MQINSLQLKCLDKYYLLDNVYGILMVWVWMLIFSQFTI